MLYEVITHLYASSLFVPYLKKLELPDMVIAAPDMGGSKRANAYSRYLNSEMVICYKLRKKANVISEMKVIGDVEGKDIIIVDDMIDTAGTLCLAADMMMEQGASSVRAVATHPVLSGPAYDRINQSSLKELVVSDTIPLKQECEKIQVISVADLFADVINNVYKYKSISSNFIF